MSLRVQLLCLGLLTLVLPWAAYRYVQELEQALRDGLEQALLASASTVAAAVDGNGLTDTDDLVSRAPATTVYAPPLGAAAELDGYDNDWRLPESSARLIGTSGRFWAGVRERTLYLFIVASDDSLVYQSAPTELPYGDRALLRVDGPEAGWLLLHTTAPGVVRPQYTSAPEFTPTGRFENRALAYWRQTADGYALEIRVPLDLAGSRIGVALIDVDRHQALPGASVESGYSVTMSSSWPIEAQPHALLYRPAALEAQSRRFIQAGKRLRILDRDGWVLFDGGAIDPVDAAFSAEPPRIAEQILRLILARGDSTYADLENPLGYVNDPRLRAVMSGPGGVAWYARGSAASAVVVAVAPIVLGGVHRGAVVLEQGSDSILTLTNDALVNLMSFALISSLLVAVGLISYATYLSMRVRRLARAADTALSPKGDIDPQLPGRSARDEIGDLARSFTALLRRLRDHTSYLTTLKGKLAHELRTPLAVVATSLENIEREPHGANLDPYLERLRQGTERLDSILLSMSEATALEHAVTGMSRERFDIKPVVGGCVAGYRSVYHDRHFDYIEHPGSTELVGSADLIAQMLDKLIDNAVSFSSSGSTITVALATSPTEIRLSVSNSGPRLPVAMRDSLFDSLVSVRAQGGQRGHLGLGLYVVALIADFHGGSVSAEDLDDATGVVFTVTLPRLAAGADHTPSGRRAQ